MALLQASGCDVELTSEEVESGGVDDLVAALVQQVEQVGGQGSGATDCTHRELLCGSHWDLRALEQIPLEVLGLQCCSGNGFDQHEYFEAQLLCIMGTGGLRFFYFF